jgi:hypothetical protein
MRTPLPRFQFNHCFHRESPRSEAVSIAGVPPTPHPTPPAPRSTLSPGLSAEHSTAELNGGLDAFPGFGTELTAGMAWTPGAGYQGLLNFDFTRPEGEQPIRTKYNPRPSGTFR